MNPLAPLLPALTHLPFYLAIDGVSGILYAHVGQVNPETTVTIFLIRGLANASFYYLANKILKGKDLQSHKIFIVTSAAINMTFLIAMRELNLIGRFFSCMLGLCVVGVLIHRVRYIQNQESRPALDDAILDPDKI